MDDHQNHAELFVERDQLAYQRLVVERQTRAMDVRQWQCVEEIESLRRKDRDGARARQVIRLLEVVQHPLQVGGDRFAVRVAERLAGQRGGRLLHAVLHLDQILAAGAIAWLHLEIARHDPVWARVDRR